MTSDLESEWEAQEPPSDFAERVLARAMRERPQRVRRWVAIGGIALAAAAAVTLVVATRPSPSRGEMRATQRAEVRIGSRAVAVMEPGAHITWRGDTVEQDAGAVFYRVEPGSTFAVHTPAGDADVLGTCFRISIDDKEQIMKRRDLGAGAIGAVAAVAVVVGVYEGKVRVSHAGQTMTVRAGESVVADPSGVHARVVATTVDDGAKAARTTDDLKLRLAQIEQEKASLEQELTAALDGTPKKSEYDLSREDWERLAKQGSIKYQVPCFREGGFRPTAEQLQRMGLAAGDADAIQAAFRRSNERFRPAMAPICAELGGEEAKDMSRCMTKLFSTIYEHGPDSARPMFTQVAEIRAGKRSQPPPTELTPPTKMLLYFTGEMTTFEADLASTFGADEAHRIAYSSELCFQANTY